MDCGAWSREVEKIENELRVELSDDKMLTTPYNLMLPYDWSDERCKEFILKYFEKVIVSLKKSMQSDINKNMKKNMDMNVERRILIIVSRCLLRNIVTELIYRQLLIG